MTRPAIYLLGTTHSSKKSKKQIKRIFERYNIDAVLSEGVKGKWNKNLLLKEPFLSVIVETYLWLLHIKGSELSLIVELAKKRNIPMYNIDVTLSEMINAFHRRYNYLIPVILLSTFYYYTGQVWSTSLIIKIIMSIVMACIFYLGYFVLKTKNLRDISFIDKTNKIQKGRKYKRILIVCGHHHCQAIKEKLDVIDLSKIIKTN